MIHNQQYIEQQLKQQFATTKNEKDARKALIMLAALKSGDDKNNALLLQAMPYIEFTNDGKAIPLNGTDDELSGEKRKEKKAAKSNQQNAAASADPASPGKLRFGERFTQVLDKVNNFTSNLQLPKVRVEVDAEKVRGAAVTWVKDNKKTIAIGAGISLVTIGGIIYMMKSGRKK